MGRSMPKPFSYLPDPRLNREEKLLLPLKVAGQIVYLLILIVVLIFAIRKRKSNNSSGGGGQAQAPVSVSFTSDDGDTSSGTQIAMGPTSLAFSTTMAC
nr:hypothetical protein CFP56_69895 [Quercus suber]